MKAGLYIHIPFCIRKCRYCDFYSLTDRNRIDAFLSALHREIRLRAATCKASFDSMYIGGGTPSILSSSQIGSILDALFRCFRVEAECEITLEANPGTVDGQGLLRLRSLGINRLQLGIQSFQDEVLRFLGRIHTGREAERILLEALAIGGWKVGADLMYNIPVRDRFALMQDLEQIVRIGPHHLSCYSLSVEEGTGLHDALQRREFQPLPEAEEAERFRIVAETLSQAGYVQYEVSNFAWVPNGGDDQVNRSRHNGKYWSGAPYLGLGPGAHSYVPHVRSWNDRNLAGYMENLAADRLPPGGSEELNPENRMVEAIFLGLRTSDGIDVQDFQKDFGIDLVGIIRQMMEKRHYRPLMAFHDTRVALTRDGWVVMDAVVRQILDRISGR
jgi:oxygen-independent coproporphyrinogen-3 oxidase